MEVAVYDTYVVKPNGDTAHFDIIVPKETSLEEALAFGKKHLIGQAPEGILSTEECQFCHVETPTPEMIADIKKQGYFILEMDDIPANLPTKATRRQLIEHIRAHSVQHRFANFRAVQEQELWAILQGLEKPPKSE